MDWIRCSERLPPHSPKYSEDVQVTVIDFDEKRRITTGYYSSMNSAWYSAYSDIELHDVIAWRELGEPYGGPRI